MADMGSSVGAGEQAVSAQLNGTISTKGKSKRRVVISVCSLSQAVSCCWGEGMISLVAARQ
jgi:hypothetical protein